MKNAQIEINDANYSACHGTVYLKLRCIVLTVAIRKKSSYLEFVFIEVDENIMMKLVKTKKNYFIIFLLCFLSHGFMIAVSGIWWDDWTLRTSNLNQLIDISSQVGTDPLTPLIRYFLLILPEGVYRIILFLIFDFSCILLYWILKHIPVFKNNSAFWITVLFISCPVNDARITLICSIYTICLFVFLLAFSFVVLLYIRKNKCYFLIRIVSLALFFYSFFTASLLVFFAVVWLYIFYMNWIRNKNLKTLARNISFFRKNWDYILLPFVFWGVKNLLFHPNTAYEGYNSVTLSLLFSTIKQLPINSAKTFLKIFLNYFKNTSVVLIIILLIIIFAYIVFRKNRITEMHEWEGLFNIKMLALGLFVFLVAIFPYLVVRNGNSLISVGVDSRDTILAGFGLSIVFYYSIRLLLRFHVLQKCIFICVFLLGSFYFIDAYLNYQEDWYQQLEFYSELKQNELYKDKHTFLCVFTNPSPINGLRFYSLNGLSYSASGKMDKLMMSNLNDLSYGAQFDSIVLEHYNMDDYDAKDTTIDGVFFINNEPIQNRELMYIRMNEAIDMDKFESIIESKKRIAYCNISKTQSDKIYYDYSHNVLTNEKIKEIINDS